jgi:hypothetical protein
MTPNKFQPALWAGIIIGVLSGVPFVNFVNCLCCAWVLLGGVLAVMFYKNKLTFDSPPLSSGDCIAVGALAGVIGAVVSTIISTILLFIIGDIASKYIMDFVIKIYDRLGIPQEVYDQLLSQMQMSAHPDPVNIIVMFIISAAIFAIFGLLGGLIGYSIFKSKVPPAPVVPPPPATGV